MNRDNPIIVPAALLLICAFAALTYYMRRPNPAPAPQPHWKMIDGVTETYYWIDTNRFLTLGDGMEMMPVGTNKWQIRRKE